MTFRVSRSGQWVEERGKDQMNECVELLLEGRGRR